MICIPSMSVADARQRLIEIVAAEGAATRATAHLAPATSGISPCDAARVTLRMVLEAHAEALALRPGLAAGTRRGHIAACGVLARTVVGPGPFGDRPATTLDDNALDQLLTARGATVGTGTLLLNLVVLRAVMRRARRRGLLPGWAEPDWPTMRYTPERGSRARSAEELAELFAALAAELRDRGSFVGHALALQHETGSRIGVIASSPAGAWRVADPRLVVRRDKTGDRDVPLTPAAVRLVLDAQARWTTPATGTLWPRKPATVRGRVYDTLKRIGTDIRPHDLRAGAGQRMVDAGVPIHVVADLLGNSPATLLKSYLTASRSARRAAMRAHVGVAPEHAPEHAAAEPRPASVCETLLSSFPIRDLSASANPEAPGRTAQPLAPAARAGRAPGSQRVQLRRLACSCTRRDALAANPSSAKCPRRNALLAEHPRVEHSEPGGDHVPADRRLIARQAPDDVDQRRELLPAHHRWMQHAGRYAQRQRNPYDVVEARCAGRPAHQPTDRRLLHLDTGRAPFGRARKRGLRQPPDCHEVGYALGDPVGRLHFRLDLLVDFA